MRTVRGMPDDKWNIAINVASAYAEIRGAQELLRQASINLATLPLPAPVLESCRELADEVKVLHTKVGQVLRAVRR